MKLDHVAIWTDDIERLRQYYSKFFGARAGGNYVLVVWGDLSYKNL